MWNSLACAVSLLALVPAQAQSLKIANARFTYSPLLGMERSSSKFLPADQLVLTFDIDNLSMEAKSRKVVYSVAMEFLNEKGKKVFSQENQNIEELNALGGTSLSTFVSGSIGRDTTPGKYKLRIRVVDRVGKKKAELTRNFEVLKRGFGLVRVEIPAVAFVGQHFPVVFAVEGFGKNARKIPHLSLKLTIYDDKDKPTMFRPIRSEIPKDLSEDVKAEELVAVPFGYQFRLTRAGKFTIKLEATDHTTKKTVELPYKITVLDPRKIEAEK